MFKNKVKKFVITFFFFLFLVNICFADNPHQDRLNTVLPFAKEQLPDSNLIPVGTGVFICRFSSGNFVRAIKMLVLK